MAVRACFLMVGLVWIGSPTERAAVLVAELAELRSRPGPRRCIDRASSPPHPPPDSRPLTSSRRRFGPPPARDVTTFAPALLLVAAIWPLHELPTAAIPQACSACRSKAMRERRGPRVSHHSHPASASRPPDQSMERSKRFNPSIGDLPVDHGRGSRTAPLFVNPPALFITPSTNRSGRRRKTA
jgi:hypothetical protein